MTTRTCDGTDEELRREQVSRVSATGQETVEWIPCNCGEQINDSQRVLIYPHYFLPHNMDSQARKAVKERIAEMVEGGKTAEEIRQWLTSQRLDVTVKERNELSKGNTMDDSFRADENSTTGDDATEVVSAEGTGATADQDATDEALATEREGTDAESPAEAAERRTSQGF